MKSETSRYYSLGQTGIYLILRNHLRFEIWWTARDDFGLYLGFIGIERVPK